MATILGRNAKAAISTDGTNYFNLGKVTSGGLSISVDMADETNNDSAGWKEEKPADKQASLEVSGKFNSSDTAQSMAMTAQLAGTTVYLRFRPAEGAGETQWIGLFHCNDFSVETETGGVEEFSASFQSSGVVARSTQT